jgi:multimeric flavodoxin WrbA
MATLVVWASPNENGLTASAKNSILAGINDAGGEADVVHLNKCNLKHCLGCGNGWGNCKSEGQCIIPDDFASIYDKIMKADRIVWITPVYWHDLAENLKCLLDRLRRCETAHNHFIRGKRNLLIACAGGTGRGAIQCLYNLEKTLAHMDMESVDRLPVIRFNRDYMIPALRRAGETFAKQ